MKIEAILRTDEPAVTPITFAEAVIRFFMDDATDPESALLAAKALDEIECYLKVFNAHHPVYGYEEILNGKA